MLMFNTLLLELVGWLAGWLADVVTEPIVMQIPSHPIKPGRVRHKPVDSLSWFMCILIGWSDVVVKLIFIQIPGHPMNHTEPAIDQYICLILVG